MRLIALSILFALDIAMVFGQDNVKDTIENYPKVFDGDESKNAEYPGGNSKFYKFIAKNFYYPAESRRLGEQEKLVAKFFIEADGQVTGITLVNKVSQDIDEEMRRVLKLMPKWIPGEQNEKKIRQLVTMPISVGLAR